MSPFQIGISSGVERGKYVLVRETKEGHEILMEGDNGCLADGLLVPAVVRTVLKNSDDQEEVVYVLNDKDAKNMGLIKDDQ
jgi:hypothetical protein